MSMTATCPNCRTFVCIDATHCGLIVAATAAGNALDAWNDGAIGIVSRADAPRHEARLHRNYDAAVERKNAYLRGAN